MLENELIRSSLKLILCIHHLLGVRFHRSDGTSRGFYLHTLRVLAGHSSKSIGLWLQGLQRIHALVDLHISCILIDVVILELLLNAVL